MYLGTVKNVGLKENRDSEGPIRVLDCEISSPEDVQSVELSNKSGEDVVPFGEDVVLIFSVAEAYKLGILVDDNIIPDAGLVNGEKEIYSRSNATTKSASIKLKVNEEIILNNGGDFAVKFNELKTAFDTLKAEFNTHIHSGVTPGGGNTGITTPSLANIDPAKAEKVRL